MALFYRNILYTLCIVGGWTNPLEEYESNFSLFSPRPQILGAQKQTTKIFEPKPPSAKNYLLVEATPSVPPKAKQNTWLMKSTMCRFVYLASNTGLTPPRKYKDAAPQGWISHPPRIMIFHQPRFPGFPLLILVVWGRGNNLTRHIFHSHKGHERTIRATKALLAWFLEQRCYPTPLETFRTCTLAGCERTIPNLVATLCSLFSGENDQALPIWSSLSTS